MESKPKGLSRLEKYRYVEFLEEDQHWGARTVGDMLAFVTMQLADCCLKTNTVLEILGYL